MRKGKLDAVCQVVLVFADGSEEVKVPIILESDAIVFARYYNRMGRAAGMRVKVNRIATLASILSDPRRLDATAAELRRPSPAAR